MQQHRRRVSAAAAMFLLLAAARVWVLEPITVVSDSMSPAVQPGAHALLLKTGHAVAGVRPGDLVVFESPDDGTVSLKRVIALGGHEVAIRDAVVYVDGVARIEPGIDASAIDGTYFGPVRVDEPGLFVLGDNRGPSIDSRDYGSVPLGKVRGRVLWIWN